VGVYFHQHPILPPTLPLAGAEGGDVFGRTLGPMLEVGATEARRLLVHWAQHVEALEQTHRRLHPHEHHREVDEDRHQRDGVHTTKSRRSHQDGKRQYPMSHHRIIPRGLPPNRLPQHPEVILSLVA
jgi:hypothetical protein